MITTKEVAKQLDLTPPAVHYWIKKMPSGMAIRVNPRMWLFQKRAVKWIQDQKKLTKVGRKRNVRKTKSGRYTETFKSPTGS